MVSLSRYVCDKWARSNTLITFFSVNVFPPHNSITMALYRAQWRLKSPASRLFTHPFIHGADQSKHQSSKSLAFMRGIHRWPVNSQHKGPVTRKMFIWWRLRITYMVIHNLVKHAEIISAFCIDLANRTTEISEKAIRIDSLHYVCFVFLSRDYSNICCSYTITHASNYGIGIDILLKIMQILYGGSFMLLDQKKIILMGAKS